MKKAAYTLIFTAIFIFFASGTLRAKPQTGTSSNRAFKYYTAGEKLFKKKNYKKAVRFFYAATKYDKNYFDAWKKIAFCYYQLKMHKYAYAAFKKILAFEPEDSDAKNFMAFYDAIIKKNMKKHEKTQFIDPLWRSALLPGWGQFYNNQSIKGMIIAGAFLVSAGLTAYSVMDEKAKYEKYLNTNENQEIAYNEASDSWTGALIWTLITCSVYAGGIVDAAINYNSEKSKSARLNIKNKSIMVSAVIKW